MESRSESATYVKALIQKNQKYIYIYHMKNIFLVVVAFVVVIFVLVIFVVFLTRTSAKGCAMNGTDKHIGISTYRMKQL